VAIYKHCAMVVEGPLAGRSGEIRKLYVQALIREV
jgi:hypothetical protein